MINKKRIFIIENEEVFRQACKTLIENSGSYMVVGEADTVEDALPQLARVYPNIVIMDLGLPGMSGVEGTKVIRQKFPFIEVLVVTIHEDSTLVFDALKAGATGYLLKEFNGTQIVNSLDELGRGGAPISSRIARMIVDSFRRNEINVILAKRETEVLRMISLGKSYSQISEELGLSTATIKTYIKRIYKKLQVSKKSDAISIGRQKRII